MHDDLFAQAEALARLDARRPRQTNLRRAVSAAYYAVFHFLVEEASCSQIGSQHAQAPYRHVLGRAFNHATMKQACVSFGGGTLRAAVARGLPRNSHGEYPIAGEIRQLATTFAELQEKRHLADYDRSERFRRSEVLGMIEEAQKSVRDFAELGPSAEKRFFLACLWAWRELTNR